MSDCPKDDELLAYVRRSLTGALRDAIDQHLSTCSSCPAVVAAAAEELHTSEGGDATAPDDDRSSESSAAQNRRAGEKLGRYVILELLGRGAMGIVYAAYDPQLDRRVALKLMRPDRRRTSLAERFLREGQSMARLSHPNVVAVHDVGVLDDGIFLAMEYVAGRTLQRWLVAETRSWREILAAFIAAGNGLAAAHRAGIVHRDFKPDNVLVGGDGTVRVTDFGLARLGESTDVGSDGDGEARATSITQAGGVLGTPAYMAPEQFRGETATPAADQFAFASALYLALYGQHPFSDAGFDDLRRAVLAGEQREPPRSPVPAHVRRALRRALSTSPTDRFASVEDLLVALRADPARRAGRIAVVALPATIAAGLGVWHVAKPSSSAPEPCRAGSDRLANVWNPSVRSAISTAFTRTGLPYGTRSASRVVEQLDAYVTA
ncbi:MAG: protein kinase, partial [Myxococcales bacterium]|nr:protein kinase [Myxococcales bacterium]